MGMKLMKDEWFGLREMASCVPTLATRTETSRGWGTQFVAWKRCC